MSRARILSQDELEIAANALKRGDLVAIPTETVYGLAANAFNVDAVSKIFSAKERPSFDPLIVHVPSNLQTINALEDAKIVDASRISPAVHQLADKLFATFWPGPLTVILPKHPAIPELVTSGLDRVGIRMPAHPLAQKLLSLCNLPLAAPSANRFGRISPTTPKHVDEELGGKIHFIIDGGPCSIGVESTVITVDDNPSSKEGAKASIWLIRPGKITKKELEDVSKNSVQQAKSEHEKASPGMLLSHYSPIKPMISIETFRKETSTSVMRQLSNKQFGLLIPSGTGLSEIEQLEKLGLIIKKIILLSQSGDDEEAAKNLFASMRALDASEVDMIIAASTPSSTGLWSAISDRLSRACKPWPG